VIGTPMTGMGFDLICFYRSVWEVEKIE